MPLPIFPYFTDKKHFHFYLYQIIQKFLFVNFRLTEAHKTAIRVLRKIKYFVARRKFQVGLNKGFSSIHGKDTSPIVWFSEYRFCTLPLMKLINPHLQPLTIVQKFHYSAALTSLQLPSFSALISLGNTTLVFLQSYVCTYGITVCIIIIHLKKFILSRCPTCISSTPFLSSIHNKSNYQ